MWGLIFQWLTEEHHEEKRLLIFSFRSDTAVENLKEENTCTKVKEKSKDCEQKGKCKCDLFKIVVFVLIGKVLTI